MVLLASGALLLGAPANAQQASGTEENTDFQTGDVILDVGGAAVSSPADVRKAISSAHADGKHTILMRVKSAQGVRFVAVPIG